MNSKQFIQTNENQYKDGETGYKIIELNITDSTENIYAVVTPIKMK